MHERMPPLMHEGVKGLKRLSVSEYAKKVGKNESTIRRAIQSGKLHAIKEMVNNRSVYKIPIESETVNARTDQTDMHLDNASVHDAELIDDSPQFQLVSMEQTSFDALIQKITDISNARAESMQTSLEDTKKEYFELKAEHKKMHDDMQGQLEKVKNELMQEKIKSAQFEVEVKIKQLQSKEIETSLEAKDIKINELEESLKQKDEQIKLLETQLKESDVNFWSKARKL